MMTYIKRTIIMQTYLGKKRITRNVRMVGQFATIRYRGSIEYVKCSGNPSDKLAKWKVIF